MFASRHNQTTSGFDILYNRVCRGALHNSGERDPPPKCHPKTRRRVLDDISKWIAGGESQILWVCGSVGCGKTAIAQTTANSFDKSGQLASSFFFDRDKEGRNSADVLFATIASQLAITSWELRKQLEESIEYDPSLLSKSPEAQFEKMVIRPFGQVDRRLRKLIIIDALDECDDEETQCRILRLIAGSIERQQFPFCLLICSRPEHHLRDVLDHELPHVRQKIDLDALSVDSDVDIYFRDKFDKISNFDYYIGPRTHPWPGEAVLRKLVAQASGQFLYASCIVNFVGDTRYYPSERLKSALGYKDTSVETFQDLNKAYTQVLSKDPEPECLLKILGALVLLREPPTLAFLVRLLSLGTVEISVSLRWLHSVLHITTDNPIRIRHQSFIDFLLDPTRSGPFYIDPVVHHSRIARYCFRVMKDTSDTEKSFGLKHWCYHLSKSRGKELLEELRAIDLARWIEWSAMQNPHQDDFPLVIDWLQTFHPSSSYRHSLCDWLIRRILHNCRNKKELLTILGVLLVSRRPLTFSEIVDITNLSQNVVDMTLCQINPLVHMCSSFFDSQWGIRFDSFLSFLTTRRRAGDFFVDISAQHARLTLRCLEALKDEASTSATFFALENWTFHLSRCPSSRRILAQLRTVSTENAPRNVEVDRVISWLKKFLITPRDSVERWKTYARLLPSSGSEKASAPKIRKATGLFPSVLSAIGVSRVSRGWSG